VQPASVDGSRIFSKDPGYGQASASGFVERELRGFVEPGGDVDVTVMAYAQWLSEMRQQATNTRYQQQAELDLMRDAINANNGELVDFKRHSSQIVQQLQNQVSEIRAKLADTIAEMAQHNRQRSDAEQRTSSAIGGLQQAMGSRQDTSDTSSKTLKEKLDRLSSDVEAKLRSLEGEVGNVKRAVGSVQDQTIAKFSEVDKAMTIFHGNISGSRQELADTREDWKKSHDMLGQAISTLSQDLADFQKHSSTSMNKLQSDTYALEEIGRDSKERQSRMDAQLTGIQQSVYSTSNEMILLKDETKAAGMTRSDSVPAIPNFSGVGSGGFPPAQPFAAAPQQLRPQAPPPLVGGIASPVQSMGPDAYGRMRPGMALPGGTPPAARRTTVGF
jgi:chromosome segregation ATPase